MSGAAEKPAIGEEKTCLLFEELGWFGDPGRAEVEPGEVGGLHVRDGHLAEFLAAEGGEEITVGPEVGDQFAAPWLTVTIGRFSAVVSEAGDFRQGVSTPAGKAVPQAFIPDDCVGIAHARNVVGFAGREERDGPNSVFVRKPEGREMRRAFFIQDEITVDLIGYQDEIVAVTELGQLEDFLF